MVLAKPLRACAAALTASLALGSAISTAQAQAGTTRSPAAVSEPAGPAEVQQRRSDIRYISGGAGQEERDAMDKRHAEFPLKVVLSAGSGEYIVADKLSLRSAAGELLVARDAGPVVMISAPPGTYTVEVSYQGRTQRQPVRNCTTHAALQMRCPAP